MTILHESFLAHSEEIIFRKFAGDVYVEDIIQSWEELLKSRTLTPAHRGVINMVGNCNLHLNPDSFETLMKYLKANPVLSRLKLAVVCDTARNIVFPMMAEEEEHTLKVRAFTTIEAALKWVES